MKSRASRLHEKSANVICEGKFIFLHKHHVCFHFYLKLIHQHTYKIFKARFSIICHINFTIYNGNDMNTFLVTGATGFLGYNVVKLLNSRGIQPTVLISPDTQSKSEPQPSKIQALKNLDYKIALGSVDDQASLQQACVGIDTVLHLHFVIKLGGGKEAEELLHQENVVGTSNLVAAATQAGVKCVVVSSSALAVGLNDEPQSLNEDADWQKYGLSLPYAVSRRNAEQAILSKQKPDSPKIVVVNPSFTLGPDDWAGAPANKLVKAIISEKDLFRHLTAPIGSGMLDVRDYAEGVLLAAERGIHGRRYLLSGDNVTPEQFVNEVLNVVDSKVPNKSLDRQPELLTSIILTYFMRHETIRKLGELPTKILDSRGCYAWYDTTRAKKELGWQSRPLQESLKDTLLWLDNNVSGE